eukprot:jgi/Mesvir1/28356/Mv11619-RA.1
MSAPSAPSSDGRAVPAAAKICSSTPVVTGRVKSAGMSKTLSTVESKMRECMEFFEKRRGEVDAMRKEVRDMEARLEGSSDPVEAAELRRKIRKAADAVRVIETGEDEIEFLLDAAPVYRDYVVAVSDSNRKRQKTQGGGRRREGGRDGRRGSGDSKPIDVNRRSLYRDFMRAIERYHYLPFEDEQGQVAVDTS